MKTYEYKCIQCEQKFNSAPVSHTTIDQPYINCPFCGANRKHIVLAKFMRDFGHNNPHCQHVDDAEKLAKRSNCNACGGTTNHREYVQTYSGEFLLVCHACALGYNK